MLCASPIVPNTLPIHLLPDHSYIYAYTGRLVTGIAQVDTNAAIVEIVCNIVLQPESADGTKVAMKVCCSFHSIL